ncbi:hypothetical protein IMZ48_43600 [Candidatus Bathyarchaeota archaeon]|nr:hypothetical protein [Candidatus Bathyarchaeota archaeon]
MAKSAPMSAPHPRDEHDQDAVEPDPPPDGGYGWVVVCCCATFNCFTWGVTSVRHHPLNRPSFQTDLG